MMTTDLSIPTFFVLGAPKCGTSSLHHLLGQHPEVCVSEPKEPFYFEAEWHHGHDYYVRTYFAHRRGEPSVGDLNPRNLYVPYVPRRIAQTVPNARLIVVVRDPTERAYSAWWMNRSEGREPLTFAEAIEDNMMRLEHGPRYDGPDGERHWIDFLEGHRRGRMTQRVYVDSGHYATQIQRYIDAGFDRSQLLLLYFEDIRTDMHQVLRTTCTFIGVDPDWIPEDQTRQKVALGVKGAKLRRLAVKTRTDRWMPSSTARVARMLLRRFGDRSPQMDRATEALLRTHYEPHNRALEHLSHRSMPHWNSASAGRDA